MSHRFDQQAYDKFSEAEKAVMCAGAISLLHVLHLPPGKIASAASKASSGMRQKFHDKPRRSKPIKDGRKLLAYNLGKVW